MAFDVVGVGYPCMDFLVHMDELPDFAESSQLEDYSWQGGGMVGTGLVTVSVLGGATPLTPSTVSTAMVGVVGNDRQGLFCVEDFKRNWVDTSHLVIDDGCTTDFTVVLCESKKDGARTFVGRRGNKRILQPYELDENLIGGAKYLLIAEMDEVSVAACKIARRCGVKVLIDADVYDSRTVEHMDLIDIYIGSQGFYNDMFHGDEDYRKNSKIISEMGPEIALTTLGKRGVVGMFKGEYIEVPTYLELRCVDSCGAGDVFHGAFLYALLKGWDGEQCARFACATASIKCTRLGGRAGIADEATVLRFLETGIVDYTKIDERVDMYRESALL